MYVREKLWRKVQNNDLPIPFNYKKTAHAKIIISEALEGKF